MGKFDENLNLGKRVLPPWLSYGNRNQTHFH